MNMAEFLFSDESPEFVVQPYQFEPVRNSSPREMNDFSSSEEEIEADHQDPLPSDTNW
jgi:hypothetical protein